MSTNVLRYRQATYREADSLVQEKGQGAIPDPQDISLNDSHLEILADALMIGVAYILVQSGIKNTGDLQDYNVKALIQQLPKLVQKLSSKNQLFQQELMAIRQKGAEGYLKMMS
jgi:hypothetical protein